MSTTAKTKTKLDDKQIVFVSFCTLQLQDYLKNLNLGNAIRSSDLESDFN